MINPGLHDKWLIKCQRYVIPRRAVTVVDAGNEETKEMRQDVSQDPFYFKHHERNYRKRLLFIFVLEEHVEMSVILHTIHQQRSPERTDIRPSTARLPSRTHPDQGRLQSHQSS